MSSAALIVAACVTDLRRRIIPNWIIVALICIWAVWKLCAWALYGSTAGVADEIAASCLFGGGLFAFGILYERITGKTGMGGGDVKLMGAVALYLGIYGSTVCLLAACALSIPLAAIVPRTRFAQPDEKAGALPFAPALAIGALIALIL